METSHSPRNPPVKIQPNTLYKNHFSRPSKNRKIDFFPIWSIFAQNQYYDDWGSKGAMLAGIDYHVGTIGPIKGLYTANLYRKRFFLYETQF